MKALLVRFNNRAEMKFIADLLKKLGVSSMELSEEDVEDYGMSILLKDADRSKKSSREVIIKKLKSG